MRPTGWGHIVGLNAAVRCACVFVCVCVNGLYEIMCMRMCNAFMCTYMKLYIFASSVVDLFV